MSGYLINEPHPTVSQDTYVLSGRGGAGNFIRAPATTPASGVTTAAVTSNTSSSSSSSSAPRFYSGRGGAGNVHAAAERPVLSFDEEFAHQRHIEQKPVAHVGRGGAGNIYSAAKDKDTDASSLASASSGASLTKIWSHLSGRH
ncbi:hypothetical protein GGS23DRAFT_600718 [Durotheca rogersii]|uniref:uncharacterized protein n=1 Tax=Durotheca rogersii TaxID=419775 RepID=UPI0022210D11|nr:uncharacterized protein GGS23DRAFT_600718 [Durotheca rogersii]KAI5858232.1 hypothetical protein GGS23DRAFT_600718 [Durotheca rogersii]